MSVHIDNCVSLNDGNLMPLLGLGTSERGREKKRTISLKLNYEKDEPVEETQHDNVVSAVEIALDNGYRHIDTAYMYQNEESVGKGMQNWLNKSSAHKREDIFVVTKLPCIGMFKEGIKKFLNLSLKKLNLSYVDLYLVHCPIGFKHPHDDDAIFPMTECGVLDIDEGTDLIAVWKEMEQMVEEGLTKSIGISNFNIRQIKKLLAVATIPPVVCQVEMHLNFQQKELVKFCFNSKIVVTAYAPLGSPGRDIVILSQKNNVYGPLPPLENPVVKLVAENHNVTTAQILIKFLIQQGIVAIPKSVNPERIKTNGKVFQFTLSETEIDALKLMDKGETCRLFLLTKFQGVVEHPEIPFY